MKFPNVNVFFPRKALELFPIKQISSRKSVAFFAPRTRLFSLSSQVQQQKQEHDSLETFLALKNLNTTASVYTGTLYEYETIHCLQNIFGVDSRRTGQSYDCGIDFRGYWTFFGKRLCLIGQCKNHYTRCGPRHVRELEGTLSHESPATCGILSAKKGFTEAAKLQFKASPWPLILMAVRPGGDNCELFMWNNAAEHFFDGFQVTVQFENHPEIPALTIERPVLMYQGKPFKTLLKKQKLLNQQ
ncbi:hypothetical protein G9A89_021938 [Geosiphon pyriformis]|nr:hypothetical protein G9A89_021938 [Geosiphon pyriformis]